MNQKKHKWYDVIIAWANGVPIQFKYADIDWVDSSDDPNADSPNFNIPHVQWRIKPKEVVYRLALMESPSGQNYIAVHNENQPNFCPTKNSNFVKWITESNKYEI